MTTKLASALALTVLLAGCAYRPPTAAEDYARQSALEASYAAQHPGIQQQWQQQRSCLPQEDVATCDARINAPMSEAEYQSIQANVRQTDAVRRECLYEAKVATVNIGNDGTLFYGAINQAFQENRLFTECVQARSQ